ncbi:MAG: O-antigen ligase family protein [Candidatus Acidiferrales bacterium]
MSGAAAPIARVVASARVMDRAATDVPGKLCFFFLCLFTVAIYARPEDIFPVVGHSHLTLLLGLCASAAYIGAWFCGSIPLLNSRELRLMLLLTAWFIAGVPFAYWRGGSFQVLTQEWFKTLLVFFLLTQTLVSLRRIRAVLWAIVLSELAVTAYSVLNPSRSMWVGNRFSGVSEGILGWNFLGIAVALTVPFIAALFLTRTSLTKSLILAAAVAVMMWMLVLTASRSGMMSVAFSLLLTYALILRRSSLGNMVAAALALAMLLSVCAAPGVFWERIQTIWSASAPANAVSASADASEEERSAVLVTSLRYTLEHPIFGLGLGNFSVARGTETGVPSGWLGTHNTFTQLSSEAGIPALLIFLVLLGSSIRSMWRIARSERASQGSSEIDLMARAALVSLAAFIFGAFFAHIAYEYFLYYPIAIAVGVQYLARTKEPVPAANYARVVRLRLTNA